MPLCWRYRNKTSTGRHYVLRKINGNWSFFFPLSPISLAEQYRYNTKMYIHVPVLEKKIYNRKKGISLVINLCVKLTLIEHTTHSYDVTLCRVSWYKNGMFLVCNDTLRHFLTNNVFNEWSFGDGFKATMSDLNHGIL